MRVKFANKIQTRFRHNHRYAVKRASVQVQASLELHQESALGYSQNLDSEL
jgi:NOL1/NOP2/fmu family ribosome biogenesis protein